MMINVKSVINRIINTHELKPGMVVADSVGDLHIICESFDGRLCIIRFISGGSFPYRRDPSTLVYEKWSSVDDYSVVIGSQL